MNLTKESKTLEMDSSLIKCVSLFIGIVLFFQIAFFYSGHLSIFLNAEIELVGLWLNIAYSGVLILTGACYLLFSKKIFPSSVLVPVIFSLLTSLFAPGISAAFFCVLSVLSFLDISDKNPIRVTNETVIDDEIPFAPND